jgi:hypothetical protein
VYLGLFFRGPLGRLVEKKGKLVVSLFSPDLIALCMHAYICEYGKSNRIS